MSEFAELTDEDRTVRYEINGKPRVMRSVFVAGYTKPVVQITSDSLKRVLDEVYKAGEDAGIVNEASRHGDTVIIPR